MKTAAVIVARKGSKRIPNKLHQKLGEDSLIIRKIHQLKIPEIAEIFVGSDDETLEPICKELGVKFILRDEKYCDEASTTANEMIKDVLSKIDGFSHILWAHPTNPFITGADYADAIYEFRRSPPYDSLFSVSELDGFFLDQNFEPLNYVPRSPVHKVARDLPRVYKCNGGIFIRDYISMSTDGNFFGKNPKAFVVDERTGWDIDYPWQLNAARGIIQ